jgi:DNA-binding transcriptional regulator of glucitol operon
VRRLLTPRWLAWHALTVAVAVLFVRLGLWQWHRAQLTHSPQNLGYAVQWPAFALFAVVFWARTVRDAVRPPAGAARARPARRPAPPPAAAPAPVTDEEDPELAAYNRYLAQLDAAARARGRGR